MGNVGAMWESGSRPQAMNCPNTRERDPQRLRAARRPRLLPWRPADPCSADTGPRGSPGKRPHHRNPQNCDTGQRRGIGTGFARAARGRLVAHANARQTRPPARPWRIPGGQRRATNDSVPKTTQARRFRAWLAGGWVRELTCGERSCAASHRAAAPWHGSVGPQWPGRGGDGSPQTHPCHAWAWGAPRATTPWQPPGSGAGPPGHSVTESSPIREARSRKANDGDEALAQLLINSATTHV